MSAQILLQGRLRGTEEFLLSAPAERDNRVFEARIVWLALLGEVLPRALLAELGLPSLMLGSSGGGRFLVVLPDQQRADAAGEFLTRAAAVLESATNGLVYIAWSATENLGDWTVIRKRLADGVTQHGDTALAEPNFFEPFHPAAAPADRMPKGLRDTESVSFSFDFPALIGTEHGVHPRQHFHHPPRRPQWRRHRLTPRTRQTRPRPQALGRPPRRNRRLRHPPPPRPERRRTRPAIDAL
jgi:hypothetical protein